MEFLIFLEIVLLVLFIYLGLKIVGKILGLIFAFLAWLLVGSVLFAFFLYPDYKNYKDPDVYVINDCEKKIFEKEKLLIKDGSSEGKIFVSCEFFVNYWLNGKYENLLNEDLEYLTKDKKKFIKFFIEGYKNGSIELDPKLKNEDLILFLNKIIA